METQEVFEKLLAMRRKIEADCEVPMLSSDNALLYDVARTLGLTEEQAEILAGDTRPEPAQAMLIEENPSGRALGASPHDFSHSGLGIGGLAHYEEPPIVPTLEQIERMEKLESRARHCRRCGATDVFDGAMFTNGGGDICDDCF